MSTPNTIYDCNFDDMIGRQEMYWLVLKVLQQAGGKLARKIVEQKIWNLFKNELTHKCYQELMAHRIPRWKHNLAWSKEALKHDDLVKPPSESGRGIYELTPKGLSTRVETIRTRSGRVLLHSN
jgi:hypothetical protein